MKKKAILPEILENINENIFQSPDPAERKEIPIPSEEAKLLPVDQEYHKPIESGLPPIPSDLHLWTLPIPEDYDPKNDHSYNTFRYLYSLGYRDAKWTLNESHPKIDECDEIANFQFTTDWLIFAAQHDPPSPIYSRTHPGCNCYVMCQPPTNYTQIPNDAPGLPIYANEDKLNEYKQKIFANLFPLAVDAQTMAPPEDVPQYPIYSTLFSTHKYAQENWQEKIQPVKTTQSFRLVLPLGLYRPMIEEYDGIQLQQTDTMSQVYFPSLNRIVQVPLALLNPVNLQTSISSEIQPGSYVYVDEDKTIGIVTRILDDRVFCFVPDFEDTFEIDSYTPLQMQ